MFHSHLKLSKDGPTRIDSIYDFFFFKISQPCFFGFSCFNLLGTQGYWVVLPCFSSFSIQRAIRNDNNNNKVWTNCIVSLTTDGRLALFPMASTKKQDLTHALVHLPYYTWAIFYHSIMVLPSIFCNLTAMMLSWWGAVPTQMISYQSVARPVVIYVGTHVVLCVDIITKSTTENQFFEFIKLLICIIWKSFLLYATFFGKYSNANPKFKNILIYIIV